MGTKLDDVLAALEPFGGEIAKAEAAAEIERIAADFRDLLDAEAATPRPPQVREQLDAIAYAAAELRRCLERASDHTREVLAFRGPLADEDLGELLAEVESGDVFLPAPKVAEGSMPQEHGWLARLRALEKFAHDSARSGVRASDLGGRRNPILAARGGHPKEWLAREAWNLFECSRDELGTSERSGPLHTFTEALLALATGDDKKLAGKLGDTMYPYLRGVEQWRAEYEALTREMGEVASALQNTVRLGHPDSVLNARLVELLQKRRKLTS